MDFGEILDAWERHTSVPHGDRERRSLKRTQKADHAKKPVNIKPRHGNEETAARQHTEPEQNARAILSAWLDSHETYDKDAADAHTEQRGAVRARLLRKAPDARIDLHGLTQDAAWEALDVFFQDCVNKNFEKVCIVHGKGNHSKGEAVLSRLTQQFIEKSRFAGESGHNPVKTGGTGVTWVLLKTSSHTD
jgi:DNA-nicking Smr family endonuclease